MKTAFASEHRQRRLDKNLNGSGTGQHRVPENYNLVKMPATKKFENDQKKLKTF